jgi:transposase
VEYLESQRSDIESGKVVVLFEDECHLLWGDVCGYIWGKTDERVEVPVGNERSKQTYYGAINLQTQQCLIEAAKKGDSEATLTFLRKLLSEYKGKRIVLLWDGASYHRSQEVKDFLAEVNAGLSPEQWKLTCIRFAPNDPTQNPIEDVWLQAKNLVRACHRGCKSFELVKFLFEFVTHRQIFTFPKLFSYGLFS